MTFKDAVKWNKIASAVYALGVWSMIGSYAIFKYTGRIPDNPGTVTVSSVVAARKLCTETHTHTHTNTRIKNIYKYRVNNIPTGYCNKNVCDVCKWCVQVQLWLITGTFTFCVSFTPLLLFCDFFQMQIKYKILYYIYIKWRLWSGWYLTFLPHTSTSDT